MQVRALLARHLLRMPLFVHHLRRGASPGHTADVWLFSTGTAVDVQARATAELAAAAEALCHDDGAEQLRAQLAQSRQVRHPGLLSRRASPSPSSPSLKHRALFPQATAQQLTALEVALAGIVATTRAHPPAAAAPVTGGPGGAGADEVADAQKWHAVARWATTDSVTAAATGDVPGGWAANHRRCVSGRPGVFGRPPGGLGSNPQTDSCPAPVAPQARPCDFTQRQPNPGLRVRAAGGDTRAAGASAGGCG